MPRYLRNNRLILADLNWRPATCRTVRCSPAPRGLTMMPMLLVLLLLQLALATAHPASVAHITTTSAMRDVAGAPITDCLEPHIQKFGETFYAYGLTIRNAPEQFACTIYSSADLKAWTKRAYIPVNKTRDGSNPGEAVSTSSPPRSTTAFCSSCI